MKKNFYFDIKFLLTTILICIALNVLMRKKSLDGFIDLNIQFKTKEGNANEKIDLDLLKVGNNNKIDNSDVKNLANWASWDPHDRKKHEVEPAGSYNQHTNNVKSWS